MFQTFSERLGLIVEDSTNEIYVFDADSFKFALVNRGARENLGYTIEELRELTAWDLKPEFTREQFRKMVEPLLTGRQRELTFETVHRRKDGSHYNVNVKLHFIPGEPNIFFAAIEDVTAYKNALADLQQANRRLDAILNNTKMAVFMMDHRQHCVFMNSAAETLTGYCLEETVGRPLHDVIHHTHPDGRHFPIAECAIDRAFPEENQVEGEEVFVHKNGSFFPVAFTASPIRDDMGKAVGTIIEAHNIEEELRIRAAMLSFNETLQSKVDEALAEQRRVELQLSQAQKMEAIGKLTGGVAHDFNNLLQVIGGNLQLLTRDVAGDERAQKRVQNALSGVSRAAKLASQLLSFGRRQPLEPRPLNLGRLIRGCDDMLRRTLGEEIEIETIISGGLWNCLADPNQVENAVLNLAINARDAMGGRGKLTIEAGNAFLDDEYATVHPDVTAGQYVVLAVTDTGGGMPADILQHVFEPFYTTKAEGEGSGLGLSMIYGFAKQSGGHVKIYSEVGQGTTVRLYLPKTRRVEDSVATGPVPDAGGGEETILVVEDDAAVRGTVTEMMTELGYQVLSAANADSARAIVESGLKIDLLFTDVVMPGKMRSTELAQLFRRKFPNGAVLFTSGYTQNAVVHAGRLDDDVELLSKPYTREMLARKVRQVLGMARSDYSASTSVDSKDVAGARGVVLVVEDEPLILINTVDMLRDLKFDVYEAHTIQEAETLLARHAFNLLFTDVSLPDGSGLDLASDAVKRYPGLDVIVASGGSLMLPDVVKDAVRLTKPYSEKDIITALNALAQSR